MLLVGDMHAGIIKFGQPMHPDLRGWMLRRASSVASASALLLRTRSWRNAAEMRENCGAAMRRPPACTALLLAALQIEALLDRPSVPACSPPHGGVGWGRATREHQDARLDGKMGPWSQHLERIATKAAATATASSENRAGAVEMAVVNAAVASGAEVRIDGLTSRADLNGRLVTVLSFNAAQSRFAVRVHAQSVTSKAERVLVKPANLQITHSQQGSVSPHPHVHNPTQAPQQSRTPAQRMVQAPHTAGVKASTERRVAAKTKKGKRPASVPKAVPTASAQTHRRDQGGWLREVHLQVVQRPWHGLLVLLRGTFTRMSDALAPFAPILRLRWILMSLVIQMATQWLWGLVDQALHVAMAAFVEVREEHGASLFAAFAHAVGVLAYASYVILVSSLSCVCTSYRSGVGSEHGRAGTINTRSWATPPSPTSDGEGAPDVEHDSRWLQGLRLSEFLEREESDD